MSPLVSGAAALVLALTLAACGRGRDEPVDPCKRVDAPARQLTGALVRGPVGTGLFEIVPVDGRASRSGQVSKLRFGDYTFHARAAAGGALDGRRGAHADSIPGLTGTGFVGAYRVSYPARKQDVAGWVAAGWPTPGSRLATTGAARFRGPVRLTVQDRRAGAPAAELVLDGTADVRVGFGSRQVAVRFDGFAPGATAAAGAGEGTATVPAAPPPGVVPFQGLTWSGIGMCGVRLGSTGQGGFQTVGAGGQAVNFAGPSAASPNGSAMLDATFYGFDAATAQPQGIGGVLLIQGDTGVISGIFAAGPAG